MTGSTETTVMTDEESARAVIFQLIQELAPNQSVKVIRPEHRLVEDLEYHSLALMELAFTLEDEFQLNPIREEDALKIVAVGDIEQYVISELRHKRTSTESGQ